jgi:hypothetical protein
LEKNEMFKRTILGVAAFAVLAIGLPATADAHSLSKGHAATSAWLKLHDYAESEERYFETLVDVDLSSSDCVKMSRHYVWCIGNFEYEADYDYEYDDGTTTMYCSGEVDVRYRSRWSYRPRVSPVYNAECV